MLAWQRDVIEERDDLEIKIKWYAHTYDNICMYAERLYHMTKYFQSLDREILSWEP